MEHLAIMKKSWRLVEKILNGQKKIESRWYSVKCKPWDKIRKGETIYFKDSGGPVRAKAKVDKVMQFTNLTSNGVKEILGRHGKDIGIEKDKIPKFSRKFKDKKYCILIFLKNPSEIKPFNIDKTGFGVMSAWLTVDKILKLKKL